MTPLVDGTPEDGAVRQREFDASGRSDTSGGFVRQGRATESLLGGALLQTALATAWIVSRPPVAALSMAFVGGMFLICVRAQRGGEGVARLVWSSIGSAWAAAGFWVTSMPTSFLTNPPVEEALAFPLPLTKQGFDVAFDLLPIFTMSLSVGVVTGLAGWAIWSLVPSEPSGPEIP